MEADSRDGVMQNKMSD